MRRYETTYVLRPTLGEEQFTEIIDRTNDIIKNDGGAVIWLERWGTKKLAYEINKENHGYYIYFDFAAPGSTVQEMERIFNIDDRVLRFLTIKLADSIDQEEIEKEAENAATAAAEAAAPPEEATDSEETQEVTAADEADKAETAPEDIAADVTAVEDTAADDSVADNTAVEDTAADESESESKE